MKRRPRCGIDNVEFIDSDGRFIIGFVIDCDEEEDHVIVANEHFEDVWHVPRSDAKVTKRPPNRPPAGYEPPV